MRDPGRSKAVGRADDDDPAVCLRSASRLLLPRTTTQCGRLVEPRMDRAGALSRERDGHARDAGHGRLWRYGRTIGTRRALRAYAAFAAAVPRRPAGNRRACGRALSVG